MTNPDHECNRIVALQNFANSPQVDEVFQRKAELDKMANFKKLEEGNYKLQTHSPFYYAIKNNMQGNIYLLLQKGFNQFNALSESIIQNKLNLFVSLLDVVDAKTVREHKTEDGMNLMHVFAKSISTGSVDQELLEDTFKIIKDFEVDCFDKDNFGRIPLHYAFENNNISVAAKLLEGISMTDRVDILNMEDIDGHTVFSMLFLKLSHNLKCQQLLSQDVLNLIGLNVLKLNPFVRFDKFSFPYTQLSYSLEDRTMTHPMILYNDVIGLNDKMVAD